MGAQVTLTAESPSAHRGLTPEHARRLKAAIRARLAGRVVVAWIEEQFLVSVVTGQSKPQRKQ